MEETKTQETTAPAAPKIATMGGKPVSEQKGAPRGNFKGGPRTGGGRGAGGPRRGGPRGEKVRSEFDQKTLTVRRVTRVVSGGRRFAFSVAVVTGNKKGSVGVGIGKAGDTSLAIQKALTDAKKNMINLKLTETHSIPAQSEAKNSSARVVVFPNGGRGLVAGSALRTVLELAGIKDVTGKVNSPSKNKLNIARASIDALRAFSKSTGVPVVETPKDESVTESAA